MTSSTRIGFVHRSRALAAAAAVGLTLAGVSTALAQNGKTAHTAPTIVGLDSAAAEALIACRRVDAYGQNVIAAKLASLREHGTLVLTLDTIGTEVQGGKYNDAVATRFGLKTLPDSIQALVPKARKGCGVVPTQAEFQQLIRAESNKLPRMGINIRPLTRQLATQHGAKDTLGLLIEAVSQNMGAHAAGIVPGDILVSVGDKPVATIPELHTASAGWKSGDKVKVGIVRKGTRQDVTVEVRGKS